MAGDNILCNHPHAPSRTIASNSLTKAIRQRRKQDAMSYDARIRDGVKGIIECLIVSPVILLMAEK